MAGVDFGESGVHGVEIVLPSGVSLDLEELVHNEHIVNHREVGILVHTAHEDEGAPGGVAGQAAGKPVSGESEVGCGKRRGKGKKGRHGKRGRVGDESGEVGKGKGESGDGPPARVEHHWSGRALPADAVRRRAATSWVTLFRGRNEVVVQVEGAEEVFSFPLFYKTRPVEWIESLLKALILVVIVKSFVIQAFFIPTGSMEDTLFPSDYILVEKVTSLFSRPEPGDIIVFQYPDDPTKDFIKRMVADEGDRLAMRDNILHRDGECLDEPYVALKRRFPAGAFGQAMPEIPRGSAWRPVKVPEGHCFALGDNRNHSRDSRFWGPLPHFRLKGRALAIYWPFSRWGLIRPERAGTTELCTRIEAAPPLPDPPFVEHLRMLEAARDLRGELQEDPDDHTTRLELAVSLLRSEQVSSAIEELEHLRTHLPEDHRLRSHVMELLQEILRRRGGR